ncbi:MAG: PIN domain-containing protein [Bacteroidales bacterium]|nr:PIN domain-containing protein [Bacteroidales bacterium]
MLKLFLDTNIVMDFLDEKRQEHTKAAYLFSLAYEKVIDLYCSSLTYGTVCYLLHRQKLPSEEIIFKLKALNRICKATNVDDTIVKQSLNSTFGDFEDALQYFSALNNGCDVLITRNKQDFVLSDINILTPDEFFSK